MTPDRRSSGPRSVTGARARHRSTFSSTKGSIAAARLPRRVDCSAMQRISHAPVSAPKFRRRLVALLPLGVGALVVGAIAGAVRQLEEIVEVGWFDSENLHLAPLATRWVSVFLVSLGFYVLILGVGAVAQRVRSHHGVEWGRGLLGFMVLLSWLVALHFIVIMGALWEFQSSWLDVPYEAHLILVASLAPLAWMAAFGMRADLRTALSILGAVLLTFIVALLALDPYLLQMWAVDLGLRAPLHEIHLMITGRVVEDLPYLVPIGPVVWSSFVRWRELRDQGNQG